MQMFVKDSTYNTRTVYSPREGSHLVSNKVRKLEGKFCRIPGTQLRDISHQFVNVNTNERFSREGLSVDRGSFMLEMRL